ncbi:hypothetical protein PG5_47840 [Pseudomonas sp. G5(2012)]|nr:hypothetical protein PG5_47840 [Pseudomonas sp. G5(2012)]
MTAEKPRLLHVLFPLMTFLTRCSVMKLVKQKYCSFAGLDKFQGFFT